MGNPWHGDVVSTDRRDGSTHKPVPQAKGSQKPSSADFKQKPRATSPKVDGPGEYPSA